MTWIEPGARKLIILDYSQYLKGLGHQLRTKECTILRNKPPITLLIKFNLVRPYRRAPCQFLCREQLVFLAQCLAQELLKVVDHLVPAVEVDVTEYDLVVEFALTYVFTQEAPFVEGHALVAGGVD